MPSQPALWRDTRPPAFQWHERYNLNTLHSCAVGACAVAFLAQLERLCRDRCPLSTCLTAKGGQLTGPSAAFGSLPTSTPVYFGTLKPSYQKDGFCLSFEPTVQPPLPAPTFPTSPSCGVGQLHLLQNGVCFSWWSPSDSNQPDVLTTFSAFAFYPLDNFCSSFAYHFHFCWCGMWVQCPLGMMDPRSPRA